MMFTKNVLLGSLGFATVLMVGNWSGAIAESNYKLLLIASEVEAQTKLKSSNDKYLTIEEVRRLAQEFEQDVIPAMRRSRQFGLGKRSQQLDAFVRDWSRVDPETAHFLGSWNKTVSRGATSIQYNYQPATGNPSRFSLFQNCSQRVEVRIKALKLKIMLAPFSFQRIPEQHNLCLINVLQAASVTPEPIG